MAAPMLASPDVKKTMAVLRYEAKVSYLAPSALRRAYVRTYARVRIYIIAHVFLLVFTRASPDGQISYLHL